MKTIEELDTYISKFIQKCFWQNDMKALKEEIEKLKPGDVYVEVGVDEGGSARTAHEYAHPGVYKIYIDIHNVDPHSKSIGRGKFMEQEGMVGIKKNGFFIHGDGDIFGEIFQKITLEPFVDLIFLDPHHDYESIKSATLAWEPLVKKGSVMLFHDTDFPDTFKWINDRYGENTWENLHGKVGKVIKK